jgi:hypothetical protein
MGLPGEPDDHKEQEEAQHWGLVEGDGAQGSVPFYSQSGLSQFYTVQNILLGSSWLFGIF